MIIEKPVYTGFSIVRDIDCAHLRVSLFAQDATIRPLSLTSHLMKISKEHLPKVTTYLSLVAVIVLSAVVIIANVKNGVLSNNSTSYLTGVVGPVGDGKAFNGSSLDLSIAFPATTTPSCPPSGSTMRTYPVPSFPYPVNLYATTNIGADDQLKVMYGSGTYIFGKWVVNSYCGDTRYVTANLPVASTTLILVKVPANTPMTFYNTDTIGSGTSASGIISFVQDTSTYTIALVASTSPTTSTGGVISGGGSFAANTSITVTATPNTGYTFTGWTENGTLVSTAPYYTFTVSKNRNLVANFIQGVVRFTVTTTASTTSAGNVAGAGSYSPNSSVTVHTSPKDPGFTFVNWTEGGAEVATTLDYTFTITGNRDLVANYTGSSSKAYIYLNSNPTAGGKVTCTGVAVPATYISTSPIKGTSFTAYASSSPGYVFLNWTEGSTVLTTNTDYQFIVSGNRYITANFTPLPAVSTVKMIGNGTSLKNVYSDQSNSTSLTNALVVPPPRTVKANPDEYFVPGKGILTNGIVVAIAFSANSDVEFIALDQSIPFTITLNGKTVTDKLYKVTRSSGFTYNSLPTVFYAAAVPLQKVDPYGIGGSAKVTLTTSGLGATLKKAIGTASTFPTATIPVTNILTEPNFYGASLPTNAVTMTSCPIVTPKIVTKTVLKIDNILAAYFGKNPLCKDYGIMSKEFNKSVWKLVDGTMGEIDYGIDSVKGECSNLSTDPIGAIGKMSDYLKDVGNQLMDVSDASWNYAGQVVNYVGSTDPDDRWGVYYLDLAKKVGGVAAKAFDFKGYQDCFNSAGGGSAGHTACLGKFLGDNVVAFIGMELASENIWAKGAATLGKQLADAELVADGYRLLEKADYTYYAYEENAVNTNFGTTIDPAYILYHKKLKTELWNEYLSHIQPGDLSHPMPVKFYPSSCTAGSIGTPMIQDTLLGPVVDFTDNDIVIHPSFAHDMKGVQTAAYMNAQLDARDLYNVGKLPSLPVNGVDLKYKWDKSAGNFSTDYAKALASGDKNVHAEFFKKYLRLWSWGD